MQYLLKTCLRFGQLDLSPLARAEGSREQRACAPTHIRPYCLLVVSLTLWLPSLSARADTDERKLAVLRATAVGVDPADCASPDAALHDALVQLPTFSSVDTLPAPLEDVQLAAGCLAKLSPHEEARAPGEIACSQLMAQQLGVDALLVRQLIGQGDGSVLLTIVVHDTAAASAEPARAEAVLLRRAERRSRLASVFLGTGAAVTAAGIASLLWPFAIPRKDMSIATVRIQPANSSAMLLVGGAWQGGR